MIITMQHTFLVAILYMYTNTILCVLYIILTLSQDMLREKYAHQLMQLRWKKIKVYIHVCIINIINHSSPTQRISLMYYAYRMTY